MTDISDRNNIFKTFLEFLTHKFDKHVGYSFHVFPIKEHEKLL